MIPKRFVTIIVISLFIFCAACTTTTRSSTSPSSGAAAGSQETLDAADQAYHQGQYQKAAEYYKNYLAASPNPERLESVLAAYGLSSEKAGLFNEAATAYERLIAEYPSGEFATVGKPRLAEVYLAKGDAAGAGALASQLLQTESDPARRASLQVTLGSSQWLQSQYREATSNFMAAWRGGTGQTKSDAKDGVLASLAQLDKVSLEEIQSQYGQNFPGPEATYLLVRLAASDGNRDLAISQAEHFGRYFSQHPLINQVKELADGAGTPGFTLPPVAFGSDYDPRQKMGAAISVVAATEALGTIGPIAANATIAVILPLSDKNASQYAKEIVDGLQLAIKNYAGNGSIGLMVLDTKGSDQEAARLVTQAAADPKVLAVVGPFTSRETGLAAKTADKAGLPMIAISQRSDLTSIGPNIFRIFLTPRHQAEAVARYAVLVQGHKSLAILYPDDGYGRSVNAVFANEVQRLGAQLVAAESYDPKASTYDEAVKSLTGGQVNRKASTNYQAETSFTALYIPDSASVVAQILFQMAYYDVTKMQYLGSSLWLSQDLLSSQASSYAQGAVIPAAFSELSQHPESARFASTFQAAYNRTPDQFSAYGYDAALAIIKALGQGATTREAVRNHLNQSGPIAGASGPFNFDSNGEYVIDPILLSIQDRNFILLRDSAPGTR